MEPAHDGSLTIDDSQERPNAPAVVVVPSPPEIFFAFFSRLYFPRYMPLHETVLRHLHICTVMEHVQVHTGVDAIVPPRKEFCTLLATSPAR